MQSDVQIQRFKDIIDRINEVADAAIFSDDHGEDQEVISITLDLSTAQLSTKPFEIGFPFRSFFVVTATDSSVSVNMRLSTQNLHQAVFPLKSQSSLTMPQPVRRAFLDWTAQTGKTMQILFFLRGEFKTNQISQITSGGVVITDGGTVTPQTAGTATTSAESLFAADTSRYKMQITNFDSIDIFLGDSSVTTDTGTKPGIKLGPGDSYEWLSTAACYVIGSAAGAANKIGLVKFSA